MRIYYCQNYRNDIVSLIDIDDDGTQLEQVRYSAYGVTFSPARRQHS